MADLQIDSKRYTVNIRYWREEAEREYSSHECDFTYTAYWWHAECRIHNWDGSGAGPRCFILKTRGRGRDELGAFETEFLGKIWGERDTRIADENAFLDAALGALYRKCMANTDPIPHLTLTIGDPERLGPVDVDIRELIARGVVLDPDGQRSLPLTATDSAVI